jgi:glycosyltransferase involved in cell wall biosynthesis
LGAGAPVLLSDISANKDISLPAKHYFPCQDIDALVAALKVPHEAYTADRDAVLARFDWDAVAAQTLEVYERVIGEDPAVMPVRALA